MSKSDMTDKAIAYAWLNKQLANPNIAVDELRALAGSKLTETRCDKIAARIVNEANRVRKRYVDFLNKAGNETA